MSQIYKRNYVFFINKVEPDSKISIPEIKKTKKKNSRVYCKGNNVKSMIRVHLVMGSNR
ncbi:MAG: hypothetical protein AB7V56_16615 [Candidatus Nitrosocosmicus sp.]